MNKKYVFHVIICGLFSGLLALLFHQPPSAGFWIIQIGVGVALSLIYKSLDEN